MCGCVYLTAVRAERVSRQAEIRRRGDSDDIPLTSAMLEAEAKGDLVEATRSTCTSSGK